MMSKKLFIGFVSIIAVVIFIYAHGYSETMTFPLEQTDLEMIPFPEEGFSSLASVSSIDDLRRGIHLPNEPLNSAHRAALNAMDPKMVLVMSIYLDVSMVKYLRDELDDDAEIFVRYYPTTCPLAVYETDTVPLVEVDVVAEHIVRTYWITVSI